MSVEFFPDEHAAASIAREIKSTHRAYSLFELARMFLAKPERHWVKLSTKSVAEPLYQVGENGPVSLDKAAAERAAFPAARARYYVEESVQREAPKGNFTNVARCRANGQLLGPTSYHGYQPALRKLYEERFSRRMSFAEFQREIEVINDPALVEQWKEQARTTKRFRLKPPEAAAEKPAAEPEAAQVTEASPEVATETPAAAEAEIPAGDEADAPALVEAPAAEESAAPADTSAAAESSAPAEAAAPVEAAASAEAEGPVFASLAEVEAHFRENYLPELVRTASSFQIPGETSRALADRSLANAVRQGWEQERGFPGQMMHQLRQHFTRAGLHVFKHKKRMQFVTPIRPALMEGGSLSPSIAEILRVIQGDPQCNRARLATAILGADESAVDAARKTTLASDLRWLIETGRVIEFSDGKLDLPLAPAKADAQKPAAANTANAANSATTAPAAGGAEPAAAKPVETAGAEIEQSEAASASEAETAPQADSTPKAQPADAENAPQE